MKGMFKNLTHFNSPLNDWNVENVKDMSEMFMKTNFNQPLNNWNTKNVTTTNSMFQSCQLSSMDEKDTFQALFTTLNNWDMSSNTDMSHMFEESPQMNGAINQWNVENVLTMEMMFARSNFFNQPLHGWAPKSCMNFKYMFKGAARFNQDLTSWCPPENASFNQMFQAASAMETDRRVKKQWGSEDGGALGFRSSRPKNDPSVPAWAREQNEAFGMERTEEIFEQDVPAFLMEDPNNRCRSIEYENGKGLINIPEVIDGRWIDHSQREIKMPSEYVLFLKNGGGGDGSVDPAVAAQTKMLDDYDELKNKGTLDGKFSPLAQTLLGLIKARATELGATWTEEDFVAVVTFIATSNLAGNHSLSDLTTASDSNVTKMSGTVPTWTIAVFEQILQGARVNHHTRWSTVGTDDFGRKIMILPKVQ